MDPGTQYQSVGVFKEAAKAYAASHNFVPEFGHTNKTRALFRCKAMIEASCGLPSHRVPCSFKVFAGARKGYEEGILIVSRNAITTHTCAIGGHPQRPVYCEKPHGEEGQAANGTAIAGTESHATHGAIDPALQGVGAPLTESASVEERLRHSLLMEGMGQDLNGLLGNGNKGNTTAHDEEEHVFSMNGGPGTNGHSGTTHKPSNLSLSIPGEKIAANDDPDPFMAMDISALISAVDANGDTPSSPHLPTPTQNGNPTPQSSYNGPETHIPTTSETIQHPQSSQQQPSTTTAPSSATPTQNGTPSSIPPTLTSNTTRAPSSRPTLDASIKPPKKRIRVAKPHPCEWPGCTHIATRSEHLKRHMLTHTNEKAFKCAHCFKSYGRSDGLRAHMRQSHPGEVWKPQATPQPQPPPQQVQVQGQETQPQAVGGQTQQAQPQSVSGQTQQPQPSTQTQTQTESQPTPPASNGPPVAPIITARTAPQPQQPAQAPPAQSPQPQPQPQQSQPPQPPQPPLQQPQPPPQQHQYSQPPPQQQQYSQPPPQPSQPPPHHYQPHPPQFQQTQQPTPPNPSVSPPPTEPLLSTPLLIQSARLRIPNALNSLTTLLIPLPRSTPLNYPLISLELTESDALLSTLTPLLEALHTLHLCPPAPITYDPTSLFARAEAEEARKAMEAVEKAKDDVVRGTVERIVGIAEGIAEGWRGMEWAEQEGGEEVVRRRRGVWGMWRGEVERIRAGLGVSLG